ncbi:glycylpeptide N-tetradecanoyltransferase [Xylariales sp. PMI_506]|nr:glycylpeptide N-tetradecanoyltransferase [Xylariales sp. PMI_506]
MTDSYPTQPPSGDAAGDKTRDEPADAVEAVTEESSTASALENGPKATPEVLYWYGQDRKEAASYTFWRTQPVVQFDDDEDKTQQEDGPIKPLQVEDVSHTPYEIGVEGCEWAELDLTNETQLQELSEFLKEHYVEHEDGDMRLKYSVPLLKWSLMAPGWKKQWHVTIRREGAICAFFSAIPVELRVRKATMPAAEWNFLCIHKELRSKGLTPLLFQEITRRCNLEGFAQAVFTASAVIPTPVSTCKVFHRCLNWQKLYEAEFTYLPSNSTIEDEISKHELPSTTTSTQGLREMRKGDVAAVGSLLKRQLDLYDIALEFSQEEVEHWFLSSDTSEDRPVWTYVVEDPTGKITDFFSFYSLDTLILGNPKHDVIRTAYLFYYGTEASSGTTLDTAKLGLRLNELMADALILAKNIGFDVFNAMTLLHNGLFLREQRFGAGDGKLNYYVFNYRTSFIAGGIKENTRLDDENLSGVGVVLM